MVHLPQHSWTLLPLPTAVPDRSGHREIWSLHKLHLCHKYALYEGFQMSETDIFGEVVSCWIRIFDFLRILFPIRVRIAY